MVGIIGAMDIEVNTLKRALSGKKTIKTAGAEFASGRLGECDTVVAMCGAGKVNAAICAQIMVGLCSPDCIINLGVGCSLRSDVSIGDIVLAEKVCQYDYDLSPIGTPKGVVDGFSDVYFEASKNIVTMLHESALKLGFKTHRGIIASGDKFIASDALKKEIAGDFYAICGEMEGGAIGQVCSANNIPFAVLRSISDGGDSDAATDYPAFKKSAAEKSTAIIADVLKNHKL